MIEIEKKLNPSNESIELIKNDAVFIAHKVMNDVLYDYEDLSLIKNDIWLRKRNGKFDLKVFKDKDRKNRFLDIYDEVEDEPKICEILNIVSIRDANFIEIANLTTKREKYKLGEFNIDLDIVTSAANDFVYNLLEVELMVESESEIPKAREKMKKFMDKYGIANKSANAKIIQYFYEKKRHIFDVLQQ
jgi:adenylate cyclase class IV